MADFLRVDGAPAVEVERYLGRAAAKAPSDPESAYVAGALAFRDGNLDAAKAKLTAGEYAQPGGDAACVVAGVVFAGADCAAGGR